MYIGVESTLRVGYQKWMSQKRVKGYPGGVGEFGTSHLKAPLVGDGNLVLLY